MAKAFPEKREDETSADSLYLYRAQQSQQPNGKKKKQNAAHLGSMHGASRPEPVHPDLNDVLHIKRPFVKAAALQKFYLESGCNASNDLLSTTRKEAKEAACPAHHAHLLQLQQGCARPRH